MGLLTNGKTLTFNITPGQHCVKIGRYFIWIDVPKDISSVTLNWKWGENINPEIVCNQDIVIKPSEEVKTNLKALFKSPAGMTGLLCVAIGIIGVIAGFLLQPSYSGSGMTAAQHVAYSYAMDFALPFFIGGSIFVIVGAIIIALSSKKFKNDNAISK